MKNESTRCIIGGYDSLSKSYFYQLKKKYKSVLFINLQDKIFHDNNLHNFKIYQLKSILSLLKENNVKEIIFLGKLKRPNLAEFKTDGVIDKYIPTLIESYKKGDGAVLNNVIQIFKEHNFRAVSPFKYCDEFSLRNISINGEYEKDDIVDIQKSNNLLNELSKFDNAQSVVCVNGYIIAIEAAEGTDDLLNRVFRLRKNLNQLDKKSGFLVKKPKKYQSKLVDLPVIGPKTIKLIRKANLKGLALDQSNTMIYKRDHVLKLIKQFKLKIYNVI